MLISIPLISLSNLRDHFPFPLLYRPYMFILEEIMYENKKRSMSKGLLEFYQKAGVKSFWKTYLTLFSNLVPFHHASGKKGLGLWHWGRRNYRES